MRNPWFALVAVLTVLAVVWWTAPLMVQAEDAKKDNEKELEALQGKWKAISYEEGGKQIDDGKKRYTVIKGKKAFYEEDGKVLNEGTLELDATKDPKHMDIFYNGQTDITIYIRDGDTLTQCGNRKRNDDKPPRPKKFNSGKTEGGEYLIVWKREK